MSESSSTSLPPALPSGLAVFVRQWRIWQLLVLAFLFVGGCGFYTAAGLLFVVGTKSSGPKPSPPREFNFESEEWRFRFTSKLNDWEEQQDAERELDPVLVMRRRE